jgi:hypothetical protein
MVRLSIHQMLHCFSTGSKSRTDIPYLRCAGKRISSMLIAPSKWVRAVVVPSNSFHSSQPSKAAFRVRCRTSKYPLRKSKSPVTLVHVVMQPASALYLTARGSVRR